MYSTMYNSLEWLSPAESLTQKWPWDFQSSLWQESIMLDLHMIKEVLPFMFSLTHCSQVTPYVNTGLCEANSPVNSSHKWPVTRTTFSNFLESLRWRHNDQDGVSNHQPRHCLLNCLFGRRPKKTSMLRVTGLWPGTGEFPAQMASNAENVSIWWRHHVKLYEFGEWVNGNVRRWMNV